MAGKYEIVLKPLVVGPLVKRARVHKIVDLGTYVLVQDQGPVDAVKNHVRAATEHDLARHIVDRRALHLPSKGQFANELESVEIPQEGLAVRGDGDEGAESFGHGNDVYWRLVPEKRRPGEEIYRPAWCRLHGVDGDDTVFAGSDESLGARKCDAGNLSDMEILK